MLTTILLKQIGLGRVVRYLSAAPELKETRDRIKAWQVHSYGDELLSTSVRVPLISSPTEVLVKIEAASINPLDILMKDGYGRTFNKLLRFQEDMVLPITLGRDFSGVVVDKGHDVGNDFKVGDKVYGVIPFHKQGSHAQFTIVDKSHIVQQSCALTHTEAAAVPYATLTAYSALWLTGGLYYKKTTGLKVLILGASGGVGTVAVQMLRAVGVSVVGTCSTDALPLVQRLGADAVFDYRDPNFNQNIASYGSYDIILDCAQTGHENIPTSWKYTEYITLNSPILKNTDEYGLICGTVMSAANIIPANVKSLSQGRTVKWAYFYPSSDGLKFMDKLIRNNQLIPVINKVFKFEEMPKAYEAMKDGHVRGKIVVDMLGESEKTK